MDNDGDARFPKTLNRPVKYFQIIASADEMGTLRMDSLQSKLHPYRLDTVQPV